MARAKKIKKAKTEPRRRGAKKTKRAKKIKRMPRKYIKIYRELLLKERNKVGGDLSHIAQNTLKRSQRDATGDLSGYSYHMADMASDDYDRDFSLGRATDEQKILYSIDEAMKRLKDGTYGYCLQCDKVISKKRLSALPYTELCIECQKKNEGK